MAVQQRNDEQMDLLRSEFQARYEPNFAWRAACSINQALPGLRGFWPMSSFDENGDAFDMSEQDRMLSYNGNPTYNYDDLAPYIDFDGTGDYLDRADEAGLDILGTETYVASGVRGLTWGGWFYFDVVTGTAGLMCKQNGGALAYVLQRSGTNVASFVGAVNSGNVTVAASQWYFIVGRFNPSTELKVYVNDDSNSNVGGIPASVPNSTGPLTIGVQIAPGTNLLDGRASLCFLCTTLLSDAIVGAIFQQQRAVFGV